MHDIPNLERRFWSKVARSSPEECWLWTGSRLANGYGRLGHRVAGKLKHVKAHRIAVFLDGRDPLDRVVMHTCDNPPCVNPAHLRVATVQDNRMDCVMKRRHSIGELNGGGRRISQMLADNIRQRYVRGAVKQTDLAVEFGVSQALVSQIIRGKIWVGGQRG